MTTLKGGGRNSGSKKVPLLDAPPTLVEVGLDKKTSAPATTRRTPQQDDESREAYEERAAILEYDAKLPRPEAERLAKEMI